MQVEALLHDRQQLFKDNHRLLQERVDFSAAAAAREASLSSRLIKERQQTEAIKVFSFSLFF